MHTEGIDQVKRGSYGVCPTSEQGSGIRGRRQLFQPATSTVVVENQVR